MGDSDAIRTIEYETTIWMRHVAGLTRRSRGVLDQSAYTLLNLLQVGGPMSIGELGGITRLEVSTLNRQTAALVRNGYAERRPDPDGGMARKFALTDAGERALGDEREASRAAIGRIVADWSPEDQQSLAVLLSRFNHEIETRHGRTWPRP